MLKSKKSFILASSSPRRQDFIRDLGLDFEILLPSIPTNEALDSSLSPIENAQNIAKEKAYAVYEEHKAKCANKCIIAGDTMVVLDNDEILNKPIDRDEAYIMLSKLNNARHRVISAVCLLEIMEDLSSIEYTFYDISNVYFANWSKEILVDYANSGEGLDKAGAYGIQGKGSYLVEKIDGSWATVVGFPMHRFVQMLEEKGLLI